jgi:hypothetical protein
MAESGASGAWIPLMDYAIKKGISLSTLRRYIKAGKIQYKVEQGRYLLFDEDADVPSVAVDVQASGTQTKMFRLEKDLQKAQEEIADLKMLIAIYEEKISGPRLER